MNLTPKSAQRIVSLVPSQTELLFDLQLDAEIVGITKYCIHPAGKTAGKTHIGGTKNVQVNQVAALYPTLILANYEENTEVDVNALKAIAPVHITDVKSLPDALNMIREVGELVERREEADTMARDIGATFATHRPTALMNRPTVAYLIWRKPWMVAASNTFIDAMLTEAGFCNAFTDQANSGQSHPQGSSPQGSSPRWVRYPVVTSDDLKAADPDLVFLSSEPYPFGEKHIAAVQACCPRAQVRLVDGELFSWYGSRLRYSAPYFAQLRRDLIR